jgi:hypothetical protein
VLVCDWLHSVGQNHFYVMMLIIHGCCFIWSLHFSFEFQRRLCAEFKAVSTVPLQLFGQRVIPSERSTVQDSSVWTTRTFHPDLPLCREASNCSKLHPSGRFSSTSGCRSMFDQPWDFNPKTQIWEDSCIRSDDVYSRPDELIHKASRAFKIQSSGRQSSWSGRLSFMYGNCVHQINHSDDSCFGPDVPSLDMKIAWS